MKQNLPKLLISKKYKYHQKSHIHLNREQKLIRNGIQKKINSGVYKLEETSCLCGTKDDVIISETDRYGLNLKTVICKNCGLLRTNPRLDKNSLTEFYINEYRDLYMESKEVTEGYFKNMISRGREVIELIRRCCAGIEFKGMDVLDIGCSAGGILVPFLEAGATVKGYDYDRRYLDYGNSRNPALNLCFGGLEDLKAEDKKYDLIIINHVLEHLSSPEATLEQVKGNLKPDGILYIGLPGLKNPAYYYSSSKSFLGSLHIGHLYHFTSASLLRLMKGFEPLYIDEEIKAVFRMAGGKDAAYGALLPEYDETLAFIRQYENDFMWKLRRLKIILTDLPYFLRLVLPEPVIRFIKVILGR